MPKIKLTDEQRLKIKILYAAGNSIRSLAIKYNVERGTIRNIVNPAVAEQNRQRAKEYKRNLKSQGEDNG